MWDIKILMEVAKNPIFMAAIYLIIVALIMLMNIELILSLIEFVNQVMEIIIRGLTSIFNYSLVQIDNINILIFCISFISYNKIK
jgi:hypothetical protein